MSSIDEISEIGEIHILAFHQETHFGFEMLSRLEAAGSTTLQEKHEGQTPVCFKNNQ